MKFNIDDYKGKYVMHCKTEEEARDFCNHLHNMGKRWTSGRNYLGDTLWNHHREHTGYNFNSGTYSNVPWYIMNDYKILEWSDFMNKEFTKADLKTGDVVMLRGGELGIVIAEFEVIVCQNGGWLNFAHIRDNLTDSFYGEKYDIMVVRRPKYNHDCAFDAIHHDRGTLVYDRKEPEEMTLEEVCKLLGKEIKIVKG